MKETKSEHFHCAESEDRQHGHEFWLERLRSWQTEVRDTLMALSHVQQAMLEHEEMVNQRFNALQALETSAECNPQDRAYRESQLRGYYHRARRRQESLQSALNAILEEFAAIEPVQGIPAVFERTTPLKDRVGEASWESFPASDPPSTNPG